MLIWLDGTRNRKGAPNENLARELFELFALGRGNYSEADVREAARGLSGWRVRGRTARFLEAEHDDGLKSVLGRRGPLDLEGVVEATVSSPDCPRFVALRLARTFVADSPPEDLVDALAGELVEQGWDLLATLRTLLLSRAFHDPRFRGARIASPVEFVTRSQLALGATTAPLALAESCASMGQALFAPPSVEGWPSGRSWIGSATWIARERSAWRQAEDWSGKGDLVELPPSELADALLGRLYPANEPEWSDTLRESARELEAPRTEVCRALLAAPEYHLV